MSFYPKLLLRSMFTFVFVALLLSLFFIGRATYMKKSDKPMVVATTGFIGDIVQNLAGDFVDVHVLIPTSVDPHQYRASENDIINLASANLILHNGHSLGGRLDEVFQRAQKQVLVFSVTQYVPRENLIYNNLGVADPHIWLDPTLWTHAVNRVADALVQIDSANTLHYRKNEEIYIRKLLSLDEYAREVFAQVPNQNRKFITAHEAFSYLGKAYGWEIQGIQGISTSTEASMRDIQNMARYAVSEEVGCVFTETSIPSRSVYALIAAVEALGGRLRYCGVLYSDSMGLPESYTNTYEGVFKANVNRILNGVMQ